MATNKEQLLQEFSTFLDENPIEEIKPGEIVDLFSFFSELTALKTEVKAEARNMKKAIEEFKKMFSLIESNNLTLQKQLEEASSVNTNMEKQLLRPILNDLLDIQDRLINNIEAVTSQKQQRSFFMIQSNSKFLQNLKEGLLILQRRIEQCLSAQNVSPVTTVGQPLCPRSMRVHSVETVMELDDGTVTAELRKGFFWGEEILRLAEVKVNKHEVCHE